MLLKSWQHETGERHLIEKGRVTTRPAAAYVRKETDMSGKEGTFEPVRHTPQ